MKVAIVGTGEELLLGLTENTNFGEIARRLREHDHEVVEGLVVGDGRARVRDAIRDAASRAEAVVVTGGLGPTRDDVTRDAAADAAGVPVVFREEEAKRLEARFRARGRDMPDRNRVQARFPDGAAVLPNRVGTAPGFEIRVGDARVFALSGVPAEMRVQLDEEVLPRLAGDGGGEVVEVRRLRVFGLPEAELDRSLGRLMERGADPEISLTADDGILTVTLTSRGEPVVARTAVRRGEAAVRGLLGDLVFGREDETLPGAAARELRRTGLTLAIAESCTGGLVAARLVDVPGVSASFREASVTYSNDAKVRRLGVRIKSLTTHGAVSPEVAAEMAEGVRETARADIGLSTTGIAGPEGGSEEKPVGLVYTGLSVSGRVVVDRRVHWGDRATVRDRAAKTALDVLRRGLQPEPECGTAAGV